MVKWLERLTAVPKVAGSSFARVNNWIILIVHPAVNGYLINSGKIKGIKRRGLGFIFVFLFYLLLHICL